MSILEFTDDEIFAWSCEFIGRRLVSRLVDRSQGRLCMVQ